MMLYLTLFNIDIRIKLTQIDMFKRPLLLNVTLMLVTSNKYCTERQAVHNLLLISN